MLNHKRLLRYLKIKKVFDHHHFHCAQRLLKKKKIEVMSSYVVACFGCFGARPARRKAQALPSAAPGPGPPRAEPGPLQAPVAGVLSEVYIKG